MGRLFETICKKNKKSETLNQFLVYFEEEKEKSCVEPDDIEHTQSELVSTSSVHNE
jgi:hypothetical protein